MNDFHNEAVGAAIITPKFRNEDATVMTTGKNPTNDDEPPYITLAHGMLLRSWLGQSGDSIHIIRTPLEWQPIECWLHQRLRSYEERNLDCMSLQRLLA